MYAYSHTCMCMYTIYIHMYIHIYINIYTCVGMHLYTLEYIYIYVYVWDILQNIAAHCNSLHSLQRMQIHSWLLFLAGRNILQLNSTHDNTRKHTGELFFGGLGGVSAKPKDPPVTFYNPPEVTPVPPLPLFFEIVVADIFWRGCWGSNPRDSPVTRIKE